MGYSSNREFNPLTNKVNLYSDGCGETYEQKYYFNGAYIDLCGLSVEEYMSNPCCGGNPGSNPEYTKQKNNIQIITYEKDGLVYYQAIADYPVTSNIKIRVSNETTDAFTELDIYIGDIKSQPEIGDSLKVKDASIDIKEDENFHYTPSIGGSEDDEDTTHDVYIGALPLNELQELNANTVSKLQLVQVQYGNTIDATFVIPATDVDTSDMEEEAFMKFCQENQYALVLILPKKMYEDKNYKLYNYGGSDITDKFAYEFECTINDTDFVCLAEKASDDIMPYVPLYNEDLAYGYKLTINK